MTQIELMRDILLKANFSRSAVEGALADTKRLRDEVVMAALAGGNSLSNAMDVADRYMKARG